MYDAIQEYILSIQAYTRNTYIYILIIHIHKHAYIQIHKHIHINHPAYTRIYAGFNYTRIHV